jgi:hypothetical protein
MRWKTEEMRKLLRDRRWTIEEDDAGGDADSNGLILRARKATEPMYEGDKHPDAPKVCLWVSGVLTHGPLFEDDVDRDDCEVHAVEVKDGLDSRGGLNTGDEPTSIMYGIVTSRLRKAGWLVINTIRDYR